MPERSIERTLGTRVVALVGPGGAGKTSLAEAMLLAAGATDRQGSVDAGNSVGDSSPEARSRGGSTELNLMRFDYLGDSYVLLDCPGSAGFAADGILGLAVADIAIVVIRSRPAARCSPSLCYASSRILAFPTPFSSTRSIRRAAASAG